MQNIKGISVILDELIEVCGRLSSYNMKESVPEDIKVTVKELSSIQGRIDKIFSILAPIRNEAMEKRIKLEAGTKKDPP